MKATAEDIKIMRDAYAEELKQFVLDACSFREGLVQQVLDTDLKFLDDFDDLGRSAFAHQVKKQHEMNEHLKSAKKQIEELFDNEE